VPVMNNERRHLQKQITLTGEINHGELCFDVLSNRSQLRY